MVILHVDDDAEDQEIFKDALSHSNPLAVYYSAESVEEALELFKSPTLLCPDYIFLDLNIPKQDGKAFLRIARNDAVLKTIPIIVFSTYISREDKSLCLELGAKDVLTKPASFRDICAIIDATIKS
ncbi:response regulator [Chryseosolibacter indicus]|uniref:Response regulator n=1 Tax=Chryseosolibacter indicus TaxID=2782351 RepID=A0ABS5VSI3_9BACT|nr:response regulator [Chryseosolibacter indicus]MBT1704316.1 response regulator [Chryseosolibacter indicus]